MPYYFLNVSGFSTTNSRTYSRSGEVGIRYVTFDRFDGVWS